MMNFPKLPPLVFSDILDDECIFGASSIKRGDGENEKGSWKEYLPEYEPQSNDEYDTYGCTVWGWQNAIEIMDRYRFGRQSNYSERFNYILSRIRPPGADPHKVAEDIRKYGLISDKLLPMTKSYEEFLKPDPMDDRLLAEGKIWLKRFDFKPEWLWRKKPTAENRILLIREGLRYSPVACSVSAWHKKGDVYVDAGQPNNHWCVIVDEDRKGWVVFDSYDHSIKILDFNHDISRAKVFGLARRPAEGQTYLEYLVKRVSDLISLVTKIINGTK